jgi:hypothetical protein
MRACAANMAQRWMRLDKNINHEFHRTPDADLHLWVEVVGDVRDVDDDSWFCCYSCR